ncbi:hypothetical protein HJC23_008842 [Cyclotella cryptica]|uniref:Uncharacterized protein n=1 Tax=Cyclotella cryptica TaxID=29204 RepID=A0ABD3QAH3_9STRA|eukprot:CCRYP_007510-RB/>CCRYP_007510-RB protein AED:0.02 eAED:0.02 QI:235/1/1/1/1/1/3/129/451
MIGTGRAFISDDGGSTVFLVQSIVRIKMVGMTEDAIRFCIKRKELIQNPLMNEKLYLSNQGFTEISNLERYKEVKFLFVGRNAISKMANLESLQQLRELHLENNKIVEIGNLTCCPYLAFLDLSRNAISQIIDLSSNENLVTINLIHNNLSTAKSIMNVVSISKLSELDLSSNKLDGEYASFLHILSKCQNLKKLSLRDNPIIKRIPYSHKMIVSSCAGLTSFDGKLICSEERRRCNAWGAIIVNGGTFRSAHEADRQELIKIRSMQSENNARKRCRASDRRLSGSTASMSTIVSSHKSTLIDRLKTKPVRSIVSGVSKILESLNTARQSHGNPDKKESSHEGYNGDIKVKTTRTGYAPVVSRPKAPSTEADASVLAPGSSSNQKPPDTSRKSFGFERPPNRQSRVSAVPSSVSSNIPCWSKVVEDSEYREQNSFLLLPPPPPPRSLHTIA